MSQPLPPGEPSADLRYGAVATAPMQQVSVNGDMRSSTGAPQGGGQITPQFVLRAVRRWWKVATPIALMMGFAAGVWMWTNFEPEYSSSIWLRIEPRDPYIVFNQGTNDLMMFQETQSQLLSSPLVLERVVAQSDIARFKGISDAINPVGWISKRLVAGSRGRSELFIVTFRGPDPKQSARIANAIVEAYFKVQAQDDAARTQRVLELLEEEKARRSVKVKRLQEIVKELTKSITNDDPFASKDFMSDHETLRHPIAELHKRVARLEVDREILEAKLRAEEEYIEAFEIDESKVDEKVETHPAMVKVGKKLTELREQMQEIKQTARAGENHPIYIDLAKQAEDLEAKLQRYRIDLRVSAAAAVREEDLDNSLERVKTWKSMISNSKLEAEVLKERYFRQLRDVIKGQEANLDLAFRKDELRREESITDIITGRVFRIRAETRAPARVTLLRSAAPSNSPSNARNVKKISVAVGAAFCIPFALAVVWERIVRRVDDPRQLWQADLTVVGEIARLPVSSRTSSLANARSVARDVSLFEESIDSLRTCLVLTEPSTERRVLVVTSAVSGEGKTSVASQLAVSIARSSGEATLLVDADMRSPDLHNVFDIPNEPGLAQVLSHECTAEEAIVTSWSNYVHLLPAGVLKASPHKLLGDGALRLFLNEVRSTYRHVIIDTSPILSASESLVLAKAADATLLCAMRDISRVEQVQKAYERLVNTGAVPLGTVLNGVPTSRYAYLYGTYAYSRDS